MLPLRPLILAFVTVTFCFRPFPYDQHMTRSYRSTYVIRVTCCHNSPVAIVATSSLNSIRDKHGTRLVRLQLKGATKKIQVISVLLVLIAYPAFPARLSCSSCSLYLLVLIAYPAFPARLSCSSCSLYLLVLLAFPARPARSSCSSCSSARPNSPRNQEIVSTLSPPLPNIIPCLTTMARDS
jgi:hypothetical protein